jgi:protein-S-isoprenylcysteine O-methyltransferase Ste14
VDIDMKVLVAKVVGLFVVFALALLLPAGTIAWFPAWVFLGLFFSFVVALSLWLMRRNPGLMKERVYGLRAADRKTWDKVFLMLMNIFFIAWLVLMPLDAVRFQWSRMPVWLQVVGALTMLSSFWLFYLTFRENPYLSAAVRIQNDRGQTVVSTGPYYYVRHPMYSGFALFVLGTALLLGSWFGLLFGLILVIMVATRAVLEERALREELRGYDAYMTQVKSRLIPHVW